MRVVFILGAGASAHAGAPLMHDFLDVSEDLFLKHTSFRSDSSFDLVMRARSALQPVLAKARFDIRNLETIFAAFEMASLLGLKELAPLGTPELPDAMRHVIARTLEETVRFPITCASHGDEITPTEGYARFVNYLRVLKSSGHDVSILTFNYDIALDFALFHAGVGVNYGFGVGDDIRDTLLLLKLHGSLNWGQCSGERGHIWPRLMRDVVRNHRFENRPGVVLGDSPLRAQLDQDASCPLCRGPATLNPLIVPPTLEKLRQQHTLSAVWQTAAEELRKADHVVIAGYSWPAGDMFFHHLFALGLVGDRLLRKVVVIDTSEDTIERLRTTLIGPQVGESGFFGIVEEFGYAALSELGEILGHRYTDDTGAMRFGGR